MTCEVETRGGRRTIEVQRRGSDWETTLDGRILSVGVTSIAGRWSLLIGPPSHEASPGLRLAKSYEVAVDRRSNGERIVHVNGVPVSVSIVDPRAQLARRRGSVTAETGPRSIVSPMPGRIVKVLVREGDAVAAQEGLVVVEAMKMENELRSPRAGLVTAVKVVEGMSVEGGAVLIVME
jgi:biotin carboxyl carrier protein